MRRRGRLRFVLALAAMLTVLASVCIPAAGAMAKDPVHKDLIQELDNFTRGAPGEISVWFYDLNTDDWLGLRADHVHRAASTVKVLLGMYLYHLAATGVVSLDDHVAVYSRDWMDGSGILNGVPDGTEFTLRELARLVLVRSDNTAANALMRTIGVQSLVKYLHRLGIRFAEGRTLTSPQELWEGNYIAPEDMGIAFRHIWRMSRASPKPWEELVTLLKESRNKSRLPAGIPRGIAVANKTGSFDDYFHDAGIVYHPHRPYVLVVMTRGMALPTATYYIGQVSRKVWEWQELRARSLAPVSST